MIEFHGSIASGVVQDGEEIRPQVLRKTYEDLVQDYPDLLLVMGMNEVNDCRRQSTSLQVAPFCALPNLVPRSCHRVLINEDPEVCFSNAWSKGSGLKSSLVFKGSGPKRRVTPRSQWGNRKRYPTQFIFAWDLDHWSREFRRRVEIN